MDSHASQKKRGFFERLIVGKKAPKVQKKVIRKKILNIQGIPHEPVHVAISPIITVSYPLANPLDVATNLSAQSFNIPAIEEVVPAPSFTEISQEVKEEPIVKKLIVELFEEEGLAQEEVFDAVIEVLIPEECTPEPIPFDEDALFVPLRNSFQGSAPQAKVNQKNSTELSRPIEECDYYHSGEGVVFTSLFDLVAYLENVSDADFESKVLPQRALLYRWIETLFESKKLITLLELADTRKEALGYIKAALA